MNLELSEIKAFQMFIATSNKLKALLLYGGKMYPDLLANVFTTLHNWCLKEKKTQRLRPIDLVQNSFC